MSSTGNRRGLTPRPSGLNNNHSDRGADHNAQCPRSLHSSFPDHGWTLPTPSVELLETYSPTYNIHRQSIQLPSVHTLLGPSSHQNTYDRLQYNNSVDFVAKVETPSSTIMMPSPVSIATTDVIDARKHSMKHALRSGFYDSEWQVDDAMDVLSGKAEEVTNLRQHPPTQRKASGRHEKESRLSSHLKISASAENDTKVRRTYASRKTVPRTYAYTKSLPDGEQIYVYDDGFECPAVSNGVAVNKFWGMTKAGKARKRKQLACLTCREKKIKCVQLNGATNARCQACVRFDKPCLWNQPTHFPSPSTSASHGALSPSASSSRRQSMYSHGSLDSSVSDQRPERKRRASLSACQGQPAISNEDDEDSSRKDCLAKKHHRESLMGVIPTSVLGVRVAPQHQNPFIQPTVPQPRALNPSTPQSFASDLDPYFITPGITVRLVDNYFLYRSSEFDAVLPRDPFKYWLTTCRTKTLSDRMMLYSLLALSSVYDAVHETKVMCQEFATIARHAEKENFARPSLPLIQARLNLCLYYFAEGSMEVAWQYAVTAQEALLALQFNTESGIRNFPTEPLSFESGLDSEQLMECRRRTFWSGYLLSRASGLCAGVPKSIHDADISVQLPCANEIFQSGSSKYNTAQFRHGGKANPSHAPLELSYMAFFVNIVSIHGDIMSFTQCSKRASYSRQPTQYGDFYADVQKRLQLWDSSLPPHLQYRAENTYANLKSEDLTSYLRLHVSRCACGIQLHFAGRPDQLPANTLRYNIQQAFQFAFTTLSLIAILAECDYRTAIPLNVERALSEPFLVPAIIRACDIVSSGGSQEVLAQVKERLRTAAFVVGYAARRWRTAEMQHRAIEDRLKQLESVEKLGKRDWVMNSSLENIGDNMLFAVLPEFRMEAITAIADRYR